MIYYVSRTQLLLFLLGVVGVYVVSSLSQAAVERAAAGLEPDRRKRIWEREMSRFWWWRAPDFAGMALIVLGILRSWGFRVLLPHGWGVPVLAAGIAVLALSSSLRVWLRSGAYRAEAPGSPAARSAFRAGVLVTAAELALAGAVCWYVLARSGSVAPARGSTPPASVVPPEKTGVGGRGLESPQGQGRPENDE